MESADSLLPLGLIETTRDIFLEVASYSILPTEKIRSYWNAYTITFRKIVDPTALRLENFWWHVWGSDRRYLSGPVLARLFRDFALGPTFVPLQRYHKSPAEPASKSIRGKQQSSITPDTQNQQPSSPSRASPPPRPILKKSRGPSASGPKPTARFVETPTLVDGRPADNDALLTSMASAAAAPQVTYPSTNHSQQDVALMLATTTQDASSAIDDQPSPSSEMPPPPKPSSKPRASSTTAIMLTKTEILPSRQRSPVAGGKAVMPTNRKMVFATAASRRRPVMPRRQSSQSTSSPTSRIVSPGGTTMPKSGGARRPSTESRASQESVATGTSRMSDKVTEKRPMRPSKQASPQKLSSLPGELPKPSNSQRASVGNYGQLDAPSLHLQDKGRGVDKTEAVRVEMPPPQPTQHPIGTPHKVLVRSHIDMMSATSVAGMSKETAIGYIPSDTVPVYQPLPEANDIPDSLRPRPLPAVLEPKFKPTPRSNVEPIPFAGSRSELSFLLRRATGSEDFVRQSPK
ncbi:hypothetical protein QBC42DRAFT_232519 [Cladorrhinum samala]|uniref:Nitrogen regulatory protein areA GATA-like domain-containing protein n=1 Tax=Cladorrhinum samala TaxID=585594 RepID=A0AAV9HJ34_9PEZI|nr:hypothetical protein QBC42DRAFT_232519 [Cladorrhinum samala]